MKRIGLSLLVVLVAFAAGCADAPDARAERRLVEAAERGDVEAVREMLAEGVSADAVHPVSGFSTLAAAVHAGHPRIVAELLGHGADVELGVELDSSEMMTPLAHAAMAGEAEIAQQLLDAGAEVDASSAGTALSHASSKGHRELVRLLLANGAEVNARSPRGSTPLITAAYSGRHLVAELLVDAGADLELRNDAGQTAADVAYEQGHRALAAWLDVQVEIERDR